MDLEHLDLDRLERHALVTRVERHASLSSTNDRARELASSLCGDESALVLADEQTAGRGRNGARWWTGSGSLACSLALAPAQRGVAASQLHLVSLATAIAIAEAAAERSPPYCEVGLHWPNDVFAAGRKLAGVLVESLPGGAHVIGFGVNVNNTMADAPADVQHIATTLRDVSGALHERTDVLCSILDRLAAALSELANDSSRLCGRADAMCLQHGRVLTHDNGAERTVGRCAGIAHDGALMLDTEAGRRRFFSGALIHDRRPGD